MIIGIPGTGSAGLISTIIAFQHSAIVGAVLGTIATIGWTLQGVGNAWYYLKVSAEWSACGHGLTSVLDMETPPRRWTYTREGEGRACRQRREELFLAGLRGWGFLVNRRIVADMLYLNVLLCIASLGKETVPPYIILATPGQRTPRLSAYNDFS